MNLRLLCCFLILLSGPTWSKDSNPGSKREKLNLYPGLRLTYVEGDDIKTRVFGYTFLTEYSHQLREDIQFDFAARLVLETGSNEVVGTVEEFKPNETINLNHGFLSYHPWKPVTLKAGAFNQLDEFRSPLLIGFNAFAGLMQKVIFGDYFYIQAMQSIPNNNRLTKRIGTVDQGTPYFGMATIGTKIGSELYFLGEVSHYSYNDLSSNIAEKSKEFGNSTSGIGEQTSFLYDFEGVNIYLESQIPISKWGVRFGGEYLYNDLAPNKRNTGYLFRGGFYYGSTEIFVENYRNESDTSPGFYNSRMYGHNNIQGSAIGVQFDDKKYLFNARFTNFSPIEDNSLQRETDIFRMSFSYKI